MKNYVIPVILTATVLIAGLFAFIPVQDASTVHTTIAGNIDKQDRIISYHFMTGTTAIDDSDNANLLPFKSNAWVGSATIIVTDGSGACSVNEVTGASGDTDGANTAGASQTGPGASVSNAFATDTDRVEVLIASNMDCTVVLFIDETNE